MVLKTSKNILGAPNSIGVWSVDQAASKASKAWKLLFEPFSNVQAGCWPSHSMHIYIFIVHQDHSPCPYVRHWMLCGWLKGRKMSFPGPFVFFPFWMQWQDMLSFFSPFLQTSAKLLSSPQMPHTRITSNISVTAGLTLWQAWSLHPGLACVAGDLLGHPPPPRLRFSARCEHVWRTETEQVSTKRDMRWSGPRAVNLWIPGICWQNHIFSAIIV